MSPATRARMLDEATVLLCDETSWRDPRDFLDECARCGLPCWVHASKGGQHRYCSVACYRRAKDRRKLDRQRLLRAAS